jgi:magnesium chelatase family protein
VRERVILARKIQKERFKKDKTNSEMEIPEIKKYCQIDPKSEDLLRKYVDSGRLSVRGYHRILKVARTIADLEGKEKISFEHLSEAISYRIKEGEI